ncbi:MAG: DUF3151 family protein [Acidimicrobiia bacterium]
MTEPVNLLPGPTPETILPPEPREAVIALAEALQVGPENRRSAVAAVVARWPQMLEGWWHLGELARDDVEAYACFRVGYHRGLDRLRQAGWRGSGQVRFVHPENRGFLGCLEGLCRVAGSLGESDEEARCRNFLLQLSAR